jgi:hypothetical protein
MVISALATLAPLNSSYTFLASDLGTTCLGVGFLGATSIGLMKLNFLSLIQSPPFRYISLILITYRSI